LSDSTITAPAAREAGSECPRCGNQYLMRLARIGFFENKLLPLFGYYPWVCGACSKRKYFRIRGRRAIRSAPK